MYFYESTDIKIKSAGKWMTYFLLGVLLLCAVFFSGCGSSSAGSGNSVFTVGNENCSRQEAKVIILQFQKDYSSIYGIDAWLSDIVDQEKLAGYVKNSAVSQLARVYALDAAAEGMGIELTEDEKSTAKDAAKEYIDSLSSAEDDYLDISTSDAEKLFERYLLAQKACSNITANVSTEVSDDEALVMDMQEICVSDADLASSIMSQLRDGGDFTALAQTYSENSNSTVPVSRTTYDENVTDQIFALGTGDYSDVIQIDGKYYIFYCENYFDEQLTEQNKSNVIEQRKEDAVNEVCDSFADPSQSVLRGNALSKIEIDTTLELSGPSFREVFLEFFPD